MSREEQDMGDRQAAPDGQDLLAALIRASGRRPVPGAMTRARVLEAATDAWRAAVRRRRLRRVGLVLAAAGAALAAVLVIRIEPPPELATGPVASIERSLGSVSVRGPDGATLAMGADADLPPGALLETARDGGVALRLAGGESLRLASSTILALESGHAVRLERGLVYVDAGPGFDDRPLEIRTPAGIARDVGTRFQLGYGGSELSLSVREGAVIFHGPEIELFAEAGERIVFTGAGEVMQEAVLPYGPEWEWAQRLASVPELDDRPLTELLSWVERETGRSVHFARPGIEARARTTLLHGTPARFTPMEALAVMIETTDFRYTVGEDVILIEAAGP